MADINNPSASPDAGVPAETATETAEVAAKVTTKAPSRPAAVKKHRPRAPQVYLNVTDEVIANSVQRDSSHCMLAEAVKVAFPGAQKIAVDLASIRFTDSKRNLRYTYLTPRIAQVALINYDMGDLPEPFTVRLNQGQVTLANPTRRRKQGTKGTASPAQVESGKANLEKANAAKAAGVPAEQREQEREARALAKQDLVRRSSSSYPERSGGTPPPISSFARRRSFGLRNLERYR